MAHELYEVNGKASMAYVGDVPWHGLGQQLPPDTDIDTWRVECGFNWELVRDHALYTNPVTGKVERIPGHMALARSDNGLPLALVSSRYKVVQPADVLDFYADLVKAGDMRLETAGSLRGGRKLWALATTADEGLRIQGQDLIKPYLLLATSCDKSLATSAFFTSIRAVCANTLNFAVMRDGSASGVVRVPHSTQFNADTVKAELGLLGPSFKEFGNNAKELAKRKVSDKEAVEYFLGLFHEQDEEVDLTGPGARAVKEMLYQFSNGPGSDLRSANGTAWGMVNAVTRYVDHEKGARSTDTRLNQAWFGAGRVLKDKAMSHALELAA